VIIIAFYFFLHLRNTDFLFFPLHSSTKSPGNREEEDEDEESPQKRSRLSRLGDERD